MMHIVFWQRMFSPHMMGLAEAMSQRGLDVTFVATEELSSARRAQGWQVLPSAGVERKLMTNPADSAAFIMNLSPSTIHITQGLRGNFEIRRFQKQIVESGQRLWVIMETVDPGGWRAPLKNLVYRWEIFRRKRYIDGVLAIGSTTLSWLIARGFAAHKVFPFAYFIAPQECPDAEPTDSDTAPFTFGYVGNLEPWKSPELVVDAYGGIATSENMLKIVGDGSLLDVLVQSARTKFPEAKIKFLGRLPMSEVPKVLAEIDCLILPSNVDGWGVVASEAMLVGTPVIVSSSCGVRSAVEDAPIGAVVPVGDLTALQTEMVGMQAHGRSRSDRQALKEWAVTLGSQFGAEYLEQILSNSVRGPLPKWLQRFGDE